MPARIYNDPLEFEIIADEYFTVCDRERKPYTMPGLAHHLGFSSLRTLLDYRSLDSHKAFHEAANRAALKVEAYTATRLYDKSVNVAGPVFALKNMGWRDKQPDEAQNINITIKGPAAKL